VNGFTKLDAGILQSSVMAAPPVTFKVWIALLAACRSDGVARVSPTYLGAVCRLSLSDVGRALEELASPDPHSRTLMEEGRRITRVDGGFRLINYRKYREQGIREAETAGRVERRRRKGEPERLSGQGPDSSASASSSASAGERGAGGGVSFYRPSRIDRRRRLCEEHPRQAGESLEDHRARIDRLLEAGVER
jgi:hypothetical protein